MEAYAMNKSKNLKRLISQRQRGESLDARSVGLISRLGSGMAATKSYRHDCLPIMLASEFLFIFQIGN